MTVFSSSTRVLALVAASTLPLVAVPAQAQYQEPADGEVGTTVVGQVPADLSSFPEGPEIEGIISARSNSRMQVTSDMGVDNNVLISPATEIKAKKGLFNMGREELTAASLLNGLPVKVDTVRWGENLIATEVTFDNSDLETAAMIANGTNQRFGRAEANIEANAAATEALRGRVGNIDQYNIKSVTNVYFDTGRYNLSPQAEAELCSAATEADAIDNALLLVVGYTDSTGSQEVNQLLSERRASRVVNHLQQDCGWKPWRMMTPTGMAESDPAADNSTPEGKAQNRRVSVNILVSKALDGM